MQQLLLHDNRDITLTTHTPANQRMPAAHYLKLGIQETQRNTKQLNSCLESKLSPSRSIITFRVIMSSNLVKSLARVYDPKPLHAQKRANGGRAGTKRSSLSTSNKHLSSPSSSPPLSTSSQLKSSLSSALGHIEGRVNALSGKMDKLLELQEAALRKLDDIGQEQNASKAGRSMEQILHDMHVVIETVREKAEQQDRRLDALERLVGGIQQVVNFVAEVLKHSQLTDIFKNKPNHSKSSSRVSLDLCQKHFFMKWSHNSKKI